MIEALNFAKVIFDVVICHHNLSDSAIAIESLSDVVDCHHGLSGSVITNSSALYPLET